MYSTLVQTNVWFWQSFHDQFWVTFSKRSFKAQSAKLKHLFSLKCCKRDLRALSFELWNLIQKCHHKRDRLFFQHIQFGLFTVLYHRVRQVLVLLKSTCVFSGIKFTRHFIEFVFVETKQIVSSNSNVILTQQTCGQRSGMAANLLYVPNVEIYRIVGSRSVHDFGTCKKNAFAQCRLPILKRVWPQDSSEVGTAQRHYFCKYRSHAQT